MAEDSYDILRRALLQALGPRPTPERRRQVVADLRSLAEQQERMAARDAEAQPRGAGAGHGPAQQRTTGFYVRINHEQDPATGAVRLRLSLGRAIWSEIGGPERIDVQRAGANIWIAPATGGGGHRLSTAGSLPSCTMDRAGPLEHLAPGRYAASLHLGAIMIGARVG